MALAPGDQGLVSLLRDLECKLCARLDRIDSSLQHLCGPNAVGLSAQEQATEIGCPSASKKLELVESNDAGKRVEEQVGAAQGMDLGEKIGLADTSMAVEDNRDAPPSDEVVLSLRPEWQEWNSKDFSRSVLSPTVTRTFSRASDSRFKAIIHPRPWILVPNRPFRLSWDIVTTVVIAHDMAVVPFNLAFETSGNPISDVLFWPFLAFWTIDFPLTFFTAIYRNGHLEVRMSRIAANYLRTWFLIDAFVLFSSWFEAWVETFNRGYLLGRMGKSLRVLRVLRTVKFLRFAKLGRIAEHIQEHIMSEYWNLILTVIKLISTIVWLNHFIACGWWAVGMNELSAGGSRQSWVHYYHMVDEPLDFQYFTSLHWSMTQFTPAGMEVSARTTPERVFSVFVLLFAMVTFSSFVSNITAAMTQLRQLKSRGATQHSLLRRFIRSRNLPIDLASRILHCVDHRLTQDKKEVAEGEVLYLQLLSLPLRMELSFHMHEPILRRHPFLGRYLLVGFDAMRHVCLEALSHCMLSTEDTLFCEGEPCKKVFFAIYGQLRYLFTLPCGAEEVTKLTEGLSCCEVSMWCPWVHRGTMTSECMSELVVLDVAAFTKITCSFDTVNRFAARFGSSFVEAMVKDFPDTSGINDMSALDSETLQELVERASSRFNARLPAKDSMPDRGIQMSSPGSTSSMLSI